MTVFTEEQSTQFLELLGLPADTTDVAAIFAVVEDLIKQASENEGSKPSDIAAAAKRAGLEVTDPDSFTRLQAEAAEGRQIKAAAAAAKIEASVADAISKGKITPARKKHWVTLITADPGMEQVLASVPNETAMPMSELGHSHDDAGDITEPADWFR